jgi:hypothetical protein
MALAIDSTICTLKQLLLIINMHYVLCELGINFYIQFSLTIVFKAVMTQAVSHWPLTAAASVRCHVTFCEIFGGRSGTGTGFPWTISVLTC